MIEELGPEARALLDLARQGLSPGPAAVARVRARIELAAGGGTSALAAKLGVLALVVAAATIAALYATRPAPPRPAIPKTSIASVPSVSAASMTANAAASSPSISSDTENIELEAPPVHRRPDHRRIAPPVTVPKPTESGAHTIAPASADPPDSAVTRPMSAAGGVGLAREVELVDQASEALRHDRPEAALRSMQHYADETGGRGQLAEDAAAIEIEALCLLHDSTAAARLAVFDTRFPHAAQRTRLEKLCPHP